MQRDYIPDTPDHHFQHRYNLPDPRMNPTYNRPPLPQPRFVGDGFDMRRPVVSSDPYTLPRPETVLVSQNFVDLTGSDDIEDDNSSTTVSDTQPTRHQRNPQQRNSRDLHARRLPRFPNEIFGAPEVIDLENETGQVHRQETRHNIRSGQAPHPPTSPEIEVLYARPRFNPPASMPLPGLPPLPTLAGWYI